MKLGSSMHIEALVSMLGPCKQIYTGGSRRLLNRVHAAHWCVCVVYSAESYVIFTLGCVGFVKLFRGWFSFKTEHSTRDFFILQQPKHPGSYVYHSTAWWLLVAYGRCLCPLGGYTAKLPRNFQKCNFQATGPGGYPSIPEADTVVERPILVQNGQFQAASCLKRHFVCILLHSRARAKPKNAPPT